MIKKKTLILFTKAIVSISLLVFIIINIDWNTAYKNLANASFILLTLAFLLNILERAELTYKWNLLIWARGINISFGKLFLINLIGGFWGMFLPSSLGTDVVRGYYLVKNNSEKSVSISSVFVDRILGMFSLLLLATISLIMAGDLISKTDIRIYILLLFISISIFFYFFQREATANYLKKLLTRVKYKKLTGAVTTLHSSILEYKKYPKTLILSFLITLLVQITRVFTYYLIALAFNVSFPLIYFFIFIPIIMLVIMIPISIGGFGVNEGTFVGFFTLVGMSINNAVLITFANSFINTLNTLLGGVVYLFYNSSKKKKYMIKETKILRDEETK